MRQGSKRVRADSSDTLQVSVTVLGIKGTRSYTPAILRAERPTTRMLFKGKLTERYAP